MSGFQKMRPKKFTISEMDQPVIAYETEHQTQRHFFCIIYIQLLYVVFGLGSVELRPSV